MKITARNRILTLTILGLLCYTTTALAAQVDSRSSGEILLKMANSVPVLAKKDRFSPAELPSQSLNAMAQRHQILTIQKLFPFPVKNFPAEQYLKVTIAAPDQMEAILTLLNHDPAIAFAQPGRVFYLDFVPNDSAFSRQWALERLQASIGWDVSRGDSTIVIGIIDTGIDYYHEDLAANIWVNAGEDLNGNGQVDAGDFNGIDDDGNGFIDDLRGWDFTDAPLFPDGGDYLDRDNDPMDEHYGSHGTRVAGIVAAVTDNGKGIAGVAPNCRLMPLRAGTSQGLLEEEDVASAILYAVSNGVRVLNLSFGDTQVSQLFTDVIRYAFENRCVLVTSAGNSGSDQVHYPSGYDETISVAATDSADFLAGFSNYGATIDVCAPGVAVLSTERNQGYSRWSGTSAAAPFVSGLVGLLLSQNPELEVEDIRGILTASADDLGSAGWDRYYGAGRINCARALHELNHTIARIYTPASKTGLSIGAIAITGTAYSPLLKNYSLDYGFGINPTAWHIIAQFSDIRRIEAELGTWDIEDLPDSTYTLRLRIENSDGTAAEDKVIIFIDRTAPVIGSITTQPMWDGARPAVLVQFTTDDLCAAWLNLREPDSGRQFEIPLDYQTTQHRILLTQDFADRVFVLGITAQNQSGLVTSFTGSDSITVDLSAAPMAQGQFKPLSWQLPAGYILNKALDLDRDGRPEIVMNEYAGTSFARLKIYRFEENALVPLLTSFGLAIPRDLGDGDRDGHLEILVGAGRMSYILEGTDTEPLPVQVTWMDSADFWASRFADLDADGRMEIIGRRGNVFTILENTGDNAYSVVDSLPNFTAGNNLSGVPHCEVADFDGDGRPEILLGDYDGDIYLYEASGDNRFTPTWQERLPLPDTIDFLASGDYDGDGRIEFAVGCHSDPNLSAEHEYDARYWLYRIYESQSDNSFQASFEIRFFGFESPKDFDAGVSSGDVDGDGRAELLISVFPDFYLIDFDPALQSYRPVWHQTPVRSNAALVADLDGNGWNEFYFNTGSSITGYEAMPSGMNAGIPEFVTAIPLDTAQIFLDWKPIANALGYRIYRGESVSELSLLAAPTQPSFQDDSVMIGQEYFYQITSLVAHDPTPLESQRSRIVSARPGRRPRVLGARAESNRSVRLQFSETMARNVLNRNAYQINDLAGQVSSVALDHGGQEVVITSYGIFKAGVATKISVVGVSDLDRTPIDSSRNLAYFQYDQLPTAPYLVSGQFISAQELELLFNEPLDPVTSTRPENYQIQPNISIKNAEQLTDQDNKIRLRLSAGAPIGALGQNYQVLVKNVANLSGQKIKPGRGDRLTILLSRARLDQVFTFPNPFRPDLGRSTITFANLTPRATVRIMTVNGQVVRTLEEKDGNGGIDWDLKDENGHDMASGIYLYFVEGNGDKKIGKLAIMR